MFRPRAKQMTLEALFEQQYGRSSEKQVLFQMWLGAKQTRTSPVSGDSRVTRVGIRVHVVIATCVKSNTESSQRLTVAKHRLD